MPTPRPGPLHEIGTGLGALGRGLAIIIRRPKLFWLGALPPLITSVIMLAAIIVLSVNATEIAAAITPFADTWGWAGGFRVLIAIALVLAAVLIMVIAFGGLAMAAGAPAYDKIAASVDDELGDAPPPSPDPLGGAILRALGQAVVLIIVSAVVALVLFGVGFVPVIGQSVVPVLSACFGGWMITIELLAAAFSRRGQFTIRQRRARMRRHRLRCLAFGIPTFVLLSIPFVAVLVFPVATAGGTVLARGLLDEEAPEGADRAGLG